MHCSRSSRSCSVLALPWIAPHRLLAILAHRADEALAHCLHKLPARDRELMLTRYEPGSGVPEAARRSGRSLEAAYKALARIRKLLFDCVSHQLASGGVPDRKSVV